MTDKITIYHMQDITSCDYFYYPDHEDFKYWHARAVMDDSGADIEVCNDGDCERLGNVFPDTIQIYDEDTARYWPAWVIGKLEYNDAMIEGNKLTSPIELDLVPSHDEDDGPVISADEFAKKHGDYYEAEKHFATWADADDPLSEITAFLDRKETDDIEYVHRGYHNEARTFKILDGVGNRIDITGLFDEDRPSMILIGLADYYLAKVTEHRTETVEADHD